MANTQQARPTRYEYYSLGAKFPGPCIVCKRRTGDRPYELTETALYKDEHGTTYTAHLTCVGGAAKKTMRGTMRLTRDPAAVWPEEPTTTQPAAVAPAPALPAPVPLVAYVPTPEDFALLEGLTGASPERLRYLAEAIIARAATTVGA